MKYESWVEICSWAGVDLLSLLQLHEVRLSPNAVCRAWSEALGCMDAERWNRIVDELPAYRKVFEVSRLQISETLSVDGVDPLGIVRKLLIHESTASLSRAWLRDVGFVHLEAASGIHLFCLWNSLADLLRRASRWMRIPLWGMHILRFILPLILWFSIWAMAGFRPGLLRPLVLVAFRWATERFGFRWRWGVPLLMALIVDAVFGWMKSYGTSFEFSEWAPGEIHYALAWWGGISGYEWARARGKTGFRAHAALSFFSWVAVLPLELYEGRFSPWTPFLSLLTVECFVRGLYALLIVLMFNSGAGLQWVAFGWNTLVRELGVLITGWGGIREVPAWGIWAAVSGAIFWLSGKIFRPIKLN